MTDAQAARKLAEDALAWFENDPSSPDVDARGIELARALLVAVGKAEAAEKALREIEEIEPPEWCGDDGWKYAAFIQQKAHEAAAAGGSA